MSIPIGVIGHLPDSAHPNRTVRVVDRREQTGGYIILHWWDDSDGPNPANAFDDWVLEKDLEAYFDELTAEDGRVEWSTFERSTGE